jgi:hypothetical protein
MQNCFDTGADQNVPTRHDSPQDQTVPVKPGRLEGFFVRSRGATLERARVEQFIERSYLDRFEALITDHYPSILSLENTREQVLAAVGIRDAGEEALFLERYLDEPIEHAIERVTGHTPLRTQILEIGNLASVGRGATARLIAAASGYLNASRCRYAVVTATDELRKLLRSFGLTWHTLADAHADRLADRGRSWGHYYERNPQILAAEIKQSPERMQFYSRVLKMEFV